jgi:hypothetical protein
MRAARGGLLRAITLGQLLALALFAGCLYWMMRQIGWVFESHRILVSVGNQQELSPALLRQLGSFAAAAWFVHALVGLAAVGLALLTEKALPLAGRARRFWIVAGWFVLLAGLGFAANSTLHPASVFAGEHSWWRGTLLGTAPILLALAIVGLFLAFLLVRVLALVSVRARTAGFATASALAAAAYFISSPSLLHAASPPARTSKPNIVILGIDSLRADMQAPRRGDARTPEIRAFLAHSLRFSDATTPLARTYPSWMAVLTGRHPTTTNARYNLMPRDSVHEGETLGHALRKHGYRAIYATDEVRFANIDGSFGFDQTITPPIGAVDFLLGYAGDLPLVNLVARTPAGRWLFPSNHANRAAATTYDPQQFLDRLEREITIAGPTCLAIHLTLAHWPYAWAGMTLPTQPETYRDSYARALEAVDRQFAGVLELLQRKRVLENAVVVLLSDHGEALGAKDDTMLRKVGSGSEIWNSIWGHGTSVMSPNQYRTVLALRTFGDMKAGWGTGTRDWPVSLEDVRPTLEEIATGRAAADVDGHSLLPYLAGTRNPAELRMRVRYTETDFNTPSTKAGQFAASGVFAEAAGFYELDKQTGWVQLRSDRMADLLARKERAAYTSDTLLAALPGAPGEPPRYLLTGRAEPDPRPLLGPPSGRAEPEARRLWDALHSRFPGELEPAEELPPM